jgi:hypothetical protein
LRQNTIAYAGKNEVFWLPQPALLALIGLSPTMALAAGQDGV